LVWRASTFESNVRGGAPKQNDTQFPKEKGLARRVGPVCLPPDSLTLTCYFANAAKRRSARMTAINPR
jgi:hypothetical protein